MFDSYIWDFDGTLFDTYPIMLDSMMKALEDRQVVADPKAVYRLLKEKSSKALTEKYHLDFREFSDDFHQYETLDTRQPVTFDHVYDTLTQLKQQGSKHYILTHRTIASTRELLVKEGMLEFFEENARRLALIFLPPYSPQLNLMEGVWKWLKESVINNVFFDHVQKIKQSVRGFLADVSERPLEVIDRLCVRM